MLNIFKQISIVNNRHFLNSKEKQYGFQTFVGMLYPIGNEYNLGSIQHNLLNSQSKKSEEVLSVTGTI